MGDAPRFLHRRSQFGYTDNPQLGLHSEPEAVDATTQDVLTSRAHRAETERQRAQWREHRAEIERRLHWLHSQRFRRDVTTQVAAVQRQLDRIDARIAG